MSSFHALAISLVLCVSAAWASPDSTDGPASDFAFFPDLCAKAEVSRFFLQKDDFKDESFTKGYFKERYFVETTMDFTYVFVSYKGIVSHLWNTWIRGGMGQSPNNVVFDPMDVSYALIPMLELHLPRTLLQLGLDHSCYHEVDRRDFNTTYINKVFLSAGSRNTRFHDFWQGLDPWPEYFDARRFSWFIQTGWHIKRSPLLADSTKINFGNDKEMEADVLCRYAVWRHGIWTLYAEGRSLIGYWQKGGDVSTRKAYWRQDFELQSEFRSGNNGLIIYAMYTRDDMPLYRELKAPHNEVPRFSKDGLLQVGIRYSN